MPRTPETEHSDEHYSLFGCFSQLCERSRNLLAKEFAACASIAARLPNLMAF
jgi:hypothetical protein